MPWVEPLGVESAEKAVLPLAIRLLPLAVKTVAVTPEPQVKAPETTPHEPLEDLRVKPLPLAVAGRGAHVPLTDHVPAEMMQPLVAPPETTLR